MSQTAHVQSVASLQDFRNALAMYVAESKQGLMVLDMEIRRAADWVAIDRAQYWRGEIRRAMEAVARAKDELHNARIFKRMDDYVPSCIDEKKALQRAQQRLEIAEQKSEAVRRWTRAIQHELNEFTGRMAQFAGVLENDLPKATAALERILMSLDRYVSASGPGSMSQSHIERLEESSQSMVLPIEPTPAAENLEEAIPADDHSASPAETGPARRCTDRRVDGRGQPGDGEQPERGPTMIVGDLVTGAAKLADAMKNLQMRWEGTKEQWQDAACRRFEEVHLAPLEPQVHLTLDAVTRLADVLERAQRECS